MSGTMMTILMRLRNTLKVVSMPNLTTVMQNKYSALVRFNSSNSKSSINSVLDSSSLLKDTDNTSIDSGLSLTDSNIEGSVLDSKLPKVFLTKEQRAAITIPAAKKEILVGLALGDLCMRRHKNKTRIANPTLLFEQGLIHKDYLLHLYELFEGFCTTAPKISDRLPNKKTGLVYSRVKFQTISLPCFNELYDGFYSEGTKMIPSNIGLLLTPLALCYWLCDDGSYDKTTSRINICTDSFTLAEVTLLTNILNDKFNLECYVNKNGEYSRIRIPKRSLSKVQLLLKDIMPPMMLYKIGL